MNIFITGGTGFLGSNLIKTLVEQDHHMYVLVRNKKKFESLLLKLKEEHRSNVHLVEGDISKELLGIKAPMLQKLIGHIDTIYHTAALLSFDKNDRDISFAMNVEGTKHVLDFADIVKVKRLIHVSTAYTLGSRTSGYESLYPLQSTFINPYEESKCHAEHLVMAASERFEVLIMRPAIIIGDSITGEADTTFGLYGILRTISLLKKRAARNRGIDSQLFRLLIEKEVVSNIVPVDYVTKVLTLALIYGKANTIYHITNSNPPTNAEIFEAIKEGLNYHAVEIVPYTNKNMLTLQEQKMNEPLEVFRNYLNRSITFDDQHTRELLRLCQEEPFQMDREMLLRIIIGFQIQHQKPIEKVPVEVN